MDGYFSVEQDVSAELNIQTSGLEDMWIDDVCIEETVIIEENFDGYSDLNELKGRNIGNPSLNLSDLGTDGSKALEVSSRTENNIGYKYDVTALRGYKFKLSANMAAYEAEAQAENDLGATLIMEIGEDEDYRQIATNKAIGSEYVELNGEYQILTDCEAAYIYFDAPKDVNYLLDNVKISLVGDYEGPKEVSKCQNFQYIGTSKEDQYIERRNAKAVSCFTDGYTGDIYCKECGVRLVKGTIIPAPGKHTWGDWVITKLATTQEDGERTRTCSVCQATEQEKIDKLPPAEIKVTELIMSQSTAMLKIGETLQLYVTVTPADATNKAVEWSSSDSTVATVDPNGKVSTMKAGTCIITATAKDGSVKMTTCNVTVEDVKEEVKGKLSSKQAIEPCVKVTKKGIQITWEKVNGADGYYIYGAKSGCKLKKLKTIKSVDTTAYTDTGKKNGEVYKYEVRAYKTSGKKKKVFVSSLSMFIATKDSKYTNAKTVKTNFSKVTMEKGKTKQIKASIVKEDKKKMLVNNVTKFRYLCSDSKIATVSSKGKITAKKPGICYISVYANDGVSHKIKVTVKKA